MTNQSFRTKIHFNYLSLITITLLMINTDTSGLDFWNAHCILFQIIYNLLCTTCTPQIKGYSQCIYHILHWFWNVNEMYALLTVQYNCQQCNIKKYCTFIRVLWCNLLLSVSLYRTLAWIQLWDFIIAEVIKLNQCSMNNCSRKHTPCHPLGSETLFQGEIWYLELCKSILLHFKSRTTPIFRKTWDNCFIKKVKPSDI